MMRPVLVFPRLLLVADGSDEFAPYDLITEEGETILRAVAADRLEAALIALDVNAIVGQHFPHIEVPRYGSPGIDSLGRKIHDIPRLPNGKWKSIRRGGVR